MPIEFDTLRHIHVIPNLGIVIDQLITTPRVMPVGEACCGDFDQDHEHELRERLNETRRNGYSDADECE